jgi:hypothetical protein
MKRVLRRPSPAMVIAIVALIAALGGTAIAGGVINKKKAKNIANNVVTQRAPGLSVASAKSADNATNSSQLEGKSLRGIQMWVHYGTSQEIESQSGGITVTDLATDGRQRVTFPTSVANCALFANGGTTNPASDSTNFSNFMVMLGRSTTGPNDVQVETTSDTGATFDEPVWLTVQC